MSAGSRDERCDDISCYFVAAIAAKLNRGNGRERANTAVKQFEDVWEKDAHRLERQDVHERYLALNGVERSVDVSGVPAHVAHVPKQWADDLHQDVRPSIVFKRTRSFRACDYFVERPAYLSDEDFIWNRRQIDGHLEDLLEVIPTRNTFVGEGVLHAISVESDDVNEIREARC